MITNELIAWGMAFGTAIFLTVFIFSGLRFHEYLKDTGNLDLKKAKNKLKAEELAFKQEAKLGSLEITHTPRAEKDEGF